MLQKSCTGNNICRSCCSKTKHYEESSDWKAGKQKQKLNLVLCFCYQTTKTRRLNATWLLTLKARSYLWCCVDIPYTIQSQDDMSLSVHYTRMVHTWRMVLHLAWRACIRWHTVHRTGRRTLEDMSRSPHLTHFLLHVSWKSNYNC